jgi:hypothetical protein
VGAAHPGATRRPPGSAETAPPTTAPPAHHVGDAVPLSGAGGLSAVVQVAAVVDPATPAASYDRAGTGLRYAAARLAVRDTGAAPLTTNLLDDVTVTDGAAAPVDPVVLDMSNCPVIFGGELSLAPGAAGVGCVAFELPAAAPVAAIQVHLGPTPADGATWVNP